MTGGEPLIFTPRGARPTWGWAIGSSALAVGLVAFLFPLAPLWTIVALVAVTLALRLTPLGARWVQTERSALLSGLVSHPAIGRHPRLVAALVFALPLVLLPGIAWGLSEPNDRWNGGALWIVALFGFIVLTIAEEERHDGKRAGWWPWWVAFATLVAAFLVVGAPSRIRWAHCDSRLTRAVADGEVTEDEVGTLCWASSPQQRIDGQTRIYLHGGEGTEVDGKGLVYSPDGRIERSGSIRLLIDLGDGWYWFETGSPVRDFWTDG